MILSIVLMIFAKMNKTIPFVDNQDLEDSVLYEPVKSIAPIVLPNFLEEDTESGNPENTNNQVTSN